MYLLGHIESQMAQHGGRSVCLPNDMTATHIADKVAEALLARAEAPKGGVAALVRDALRPYRRCA